VTIRLNITFGLLNNNTQLIFQEVRCSSIEYLLIWLLNNHLIILTLLHIVTTISKTINRLKLILYLTLQLKHIKLRSSINRIFSLLTTQFSIILFLFLILYIQISMISFLFLILIHFHKCFVIQLVCTILFNSIIVFYDLG